MADITGARVAGLAEIGLPEPVGGLVPEERRRRSRQERILDENITNEKITPNHIQITHNRMAASR